jgi:hypothetical protein
MPCLFSSKKPRKKDHGIIINSDGTGYIYSKNSKTLKTKMIAASPSPPPPPPPPNKEDITKIIADAFAKKAAEDKIAEEIKMLRGQVAGYEKAKTDHDRAALNNIREKIEQMERQQKKREEEEEFSRELKKMMERYGPSSEGGLVRSGGGPGWGGGGGGYGYGIIPWAAPPASPSQIQRMIEDPYRHGHESGVFSLLRDERMDRIEAWILRNSR